MTAKIPAGTTPTIAPADAKFHSPWPTWKKVVAYVLLSLLSFTAIGFVDVKVHRAAVMPRSTTAPASKP